LQDGSDFNILPRRKAGAPSTGGTDRSAVVLNRELLEVYFSMSLNAASRELVRPTPLFIRAMKAHQKSLRRGLTLSTRFALAPLFSLAGHLRNGYQEGLPQAWHSKMAIPVTCRLVLTSTRHPLVATCGHFLAQPNQRSIATPLSKAMNGTVHPFSFRPFPTAHCISFCLERKSRRRR
jgi:hypothetical protein